MVATQFGEMVMLLGFSPHVNSIRNMRVVGSENATRLPRAVSQLLRLDQNLSRHGASP